MSFDLTSKRKHRFQQPAWSGSAFLVEALLLLVFLAASVAIFMQLFSHAANQAAESRDMTNAVAVATDSAERFAADPTSIGEFMLYDDVVAVCTVEQEKTDSGTLYHATIDVFELPEGSANITRSNEGVLITDANQGLGAPIYSIETARYVSGDAS